MLKSFPINLAESAQAEIKQRSRRRALRRDTSAHTKRPFRRKKALYTPPPAQKMLPPAKKRGGGNFDRGEEGNQTPCLCAASCCAPAAPRDRSVLSSDPPHHARAPPHRDRGVQGLQIHRRRVDEAEDDAEEEDRENSSSVRVRQVPPELPGVRAMQAVAGRG